tara:strand:- start:445 stop:1077 length:633 start_codon:yes stop_codon:yes gene_type:complete
MYRLLLILFVLSSCTKEEINQTPCIGNCETLYGVVYKNQAIYPNSNGYYEIIFDDLNYFQIVGSLTPLNDQYIINDVPLVEANFDSDYWIVMDSLRFQIPVYGYLGWFNDQDLNTPIPIGSYTYTMVDLINTHPPLNIAGYQIPKHFCTDCPYASSIMGSHSKYNYSPKQNFMLDDEMIGDTINVFVETVFNTDIGESEIVNNNMKIIIL